METLSRPRKPICPILRQIVGRCHVSDSFEEVLEYVISRLANGQKTFDAMKKGDQNELKRQVNHIRNKDRNLYTSVMSGRL